MLEKTDWFDLVVQRTPMSSPANSEVKLTNASLKKHSLERMLK